MTKERMRETGKRANQGVFVAIFFSTFQCRTLRISVAMGGWVSLPEDGRRKDPVRAARGSRSLRRLQKLYPFYSVRSSLVSESQNVGGDQ